MQTVTRLKQKLPGNALTPFHYLRYLRSDRATLKRAAPWLKPLGYDRIYYYHIRKTAGTSLAFAFMNLGGSDFNDRPKQRWYDQHGWIVHGDYVFVTHNRYLIQRGHYFFADAHIPAHELQIPGNTFRITILRDPVARVISHYRMVRHWREQGLQHPGKARAENNPGKDFSDFLDKIPRAHLLRQLYMFSKTFNVDEAIAAVSRLNYVMFTEAFGEHLNRLGSLLQLNLCSFSEKAGYGSVAISEDERARLREMLAPEYALVEAVAPLAGVYRELR